MLTGMDRERGENIYPVQPQSAKAPEVATHPPLVVRHILAPFDGSAVAECTIPFIEALAQTFSARVTLLHVMESSDADHAKSIDSLEWEMARIEALSGLSRVQKKLVAHSDNADNVRIDVVQGRAAEQIVHFASREGVDLIVLSTHGAGGLHDWNLSGTVQKVLTTTEASVLLVPAHRFADGKADVTFNRMLVPLDCSPRAECILPAATELARMNGAELILAHVVIEPEMPRRLSTTTEDRDLCDKLVERNRDEAQHYLDEVRGRLLAGSTRVDTRLVTSPRPAHALRELAHAEKADLVLLCAHGNTGDPRRRFGDVPADFLRECEQPCIIIQDLGLSRAGSRELAAERPGH